MGVSSFNLEITSTVAPARLFKALCLDSHTLFPKLMPESFKSVQFVKGDCIAVGSIKRLNFSDGCAFKYVKHRIDELDEPNLYCKYTTMEGDVLGDGIEMVVHEAKFNSSGAIGSICSLTSHYITRGTAVLTAEEIQIGQDKVKKMFRVVEDYLLGNPLVYSN